MFDPARQNDVYESAERVLQTVVNVFTESGQELPDRQYVHVGTPAFDCDQVTVSLVGLASGLPDQEVRPGACEDPKTVTFIIDIVRELPQGKGGRSTSTIVPSVEKITDTAMIQMRDSKLLADVCDIAIKSNWIPMGSYSIIVGEPAGNKQAVSAELRLAI